MGNLKLTLACGKYDRTEALASGQVQPEGIDLTYLGLPPIEIFWRQMKFNEFDVCEMSLGLYPLTRLKRKGLIAIPVFPFRGFYHLGVLCNADSQIKEPRDLEGKKFGIPEYQMTAAVWMRGVLQEEFGLSLSKVKWFIGRPREANHIRFLGR